MVMIHKQLRERRQDRRKTEAHGHLKTAFMWAGQAHAQAVAGARAGIVLESIRKAEAELARARAYYEGEA